MSTTISRGRGDSCRPFPIVKIFFFVEALPAEADVCSLFVGFDAYAGMRREKKTVAGFMSVRLMAIAGAYKIYVFSFILVLY